MIHRPPVALIIWRFDKTIESDVGYITRTILGNPAVLPIMNLDRLRLILPDPTAIRVRLSHAS